jgi:serpin B
MKRLISILLSAALLFGLTACSRPGDLTGGSAVAAPVYPEGIAFEDFDARRELRDSNSVNEDTVSAMNQFSYNTAAQVLTGNEANACYSPLSLYYALALAATRA